MGVLWGRNRESIPGVSIRSTFMVGFPGEKEEHFQELLGFLREARLERVGFFAYSREEGSEGERLPDQISEKEKQVRLQMAYQTQSEILEEIGQRMIGKEFEVLIDQATPHGAVGRSYMDAPEIDGSVWFKGNGVSPGDFVLGRIVGASGADLQAVLVT